tara:strand:- start:3436 stop:3858 length:423 start_codon:yes stop_codon:yes gene_type:complete
MGNDSIKDAIVRHLEKNNVLNEEFYISLDEDANTLKKMREEVDRGLLNLKKHIISSNLHLIIDRMFKGENEEVIKMVKNTNNKVLFFNFTEELNRFLILFEQYQQHSQFNSPDLEDIKDTFALKDDQLCGLIKEINLDNK